ncbi:MAG: pyruvate kinase [Candidatus Manganitrophus sp.]|nr:MAG: pyruvate kinase [Candidatus Manganitrophus sp.]
MVARGDLGVEMPAEQVPALQKRIVRAGRKLGKPVIVATQMLESMVSAPVPTRAEASDVATAIFDGADAVMLSAESASGNYPIESVKTMARIIVAAERRAPVMDRRLQQGLSVARAVSSAACQLAWQMSAKAIVTSTLTGGAALRLSKYRPTNPILAFTPHPEIERRMSLYWGSRRVGCRC